MSIAKPRRRMTANLRRDAILKSALPLFARHGQDGVTTRELAAACGVSEALLFRHFPTKQALFDAIHAYHTSHLKPGYPHIDHPAPVSTEELARLVCLFVHYVVFTNPTADRQVMRLFYRSFIEDGRFARIFLSGDRVGEVRRNFEAGLTEARRTGDALPLGTDPHNLFWFVQHATTAACLMRLPSKPVIRYHGEFRAAIRDLVRFVLRGIGLTEAAMRKYATDECFERWLAEG